MRSQPKSRANIWVSLKICEWPQELLPFWWKLSYLPVFSSQLVPWGQSPGHWYAAWRVWRLHRPDIGSQEDPRAHLTEAQRSTESETIEILQLGSSKLSEMDPQNIAGMMLFLIIYFKKDKKSGKWRTDLHWPVLGSHKKPGGQEENWQRSVTRTHLKCISFGMLSNLNVRLRELSIPQDNVRLVKAMYSPWPPPGLKRK